MLQISDEDRFIGHHCVLFIKSPHIISSDCDTRKHQEICPRNELDILNYRHMDFILQVVKFHHTSDLMLDGRFGGFA